MNEDVLGFNFLNLRKISSTSILSEFEIKKIEQLKFKVEIIYYLIRY